MGEVNVLCLCCCRNRAFSYVSGCKYHILFWRDVFYFHFSSFVPERIIEICTTELR